MAQVSQSRTFPRKYKSRTYVNGIPVSTTGIGYEESPALGGTTTRPSQSTTSWRTGGHVDGALIDMDEALFSGGNSAETLGKLRAHSRVNEGSSKYDKGHEFSTERRWVSNVSTCLESTTVGTTSYVYDGVLYPSRALYHVSAPSWSTDFYGTAAIQKTKPTNPSVDLSLTLAELRREGLPRLSAFGSDYTKGRSYTDAVGDAYLSYEFGFKPLGTEMGKLAATILQSKQILEQFRRDSGKPVRRRMEFPDIVSVTTTPITSVSNAVRIDSSNGGAMTAVNPGPYTHSVWSTGSGIQEIRSEQKIWFSGAYIYYIPVPDGVMGRIDKAAYEANRLLGLKITPEVLWNLAPWSWLSDWNVNIGSILSNLESFNSDGLVLKYGYLMRTTRVARTHTIWGPVTRSGNRGPWTITYNTERKERVRARPYGFGSNPASYTSRQWAILGALGLTKAPRTLHGD